MHHSANHILARRLWQIALDHRDLRLLLRRQLRAPTLRKRLDRLLPLFNQRSQNLRLLRICQLLALVNLFILQRRLHHPQRRQLMLLLRLHRHHNIRLHLLTNRHRNHLPQFNPPL